MEKHHGFNLIELLTVVTIIGVLTTISSSFYSQYFITEKRLEAKIKLAELAAALERYAMINNSYKNATLENLSFPKKIAGDQYQLIIAQATDTDFLIKAAPLSHQANKDSRCGTLLLNSSGEKTIGGSGNSADCW